MSLPFFFVESLREDKIVLDEATSKHVVNVLRMKKGQEVLLTNGKGSRGKATIVDDNRKKCVVQISSIQREEERKNKVAIGISLIKNSSRFEWFLEKATEIGVNEIIPLICTRTEKEKFRFDRMQNILISAMLQSQQCRLPVLHEPTEFELIMRSPFEKKFIAHCEESSKSELAIQQINKLTSHLILIGPEGDFTHDEISLAIENRFQPISLGETRLRTETAGIAAAVILCMR